MDETQRDEIRKRNQRRAYNCRSCGASGLQKVDGSKCGGMPGVNYKFCNSCGHAWPITKKPSKAKLD